MKQVLGWTTVARAWVLSWFTRGGGQKMEELPAGEYIMHVEDVEPNGQNIKLTITTKDDA